MQYMSVTLYLTHWIVIELMFAFVVIPQSELERVEIEQTIEELQSLRDIVYDWFRKQEEIAEVS